MARRPRVHHAVVVLLQPVQRRLNGVLDLPAVDRTRFHEAGEEVGDVAVVLLPDLPHHLDDGVHTVGLPRELQRELLDVARGDDLAVEPDPTRMTRSSLASCSLRWSCRSPSISIFCVAVPVRAVLGVLRVLGVRAALLLLLAATVGVGALLVVAHRSRSPSMITSRPATTWRLSERSTLLT